MAPIDGVRVFSKPQIKTHDLIRAKHIWNQETSGTSGRETLYTGPHSLINFLFVCLVAQSCLTLCNPMDCSPPGSSVHGISQARILEWVAMFFSRTSFWARDWTHISCILCTAGDSFTLEPPNIIYLETKSESVPICPKSPSSVGWRSMSSRAELTDTSGSVFTNLLQYHAFRPPENHSPTSTS